MNRREFIRLMSIASGASLLHSCGVDESTDKLIPYLVPPEDEIIPGQALYYNSTCQECPAGCGLSVKVREGFPVKLEGLAGHPVNAGALCVRGQASLMRRYHPGRIKRPALRGADGALHDTSWDAAFDAILTQLDSLAGRRHHYLSGRTSGSLPALIDRFCAALSVERLPEWELISHAAIRAANETLFGRRAVPAYRIEDSDLLITVGADIIETFVSPVGHAVQLGRKKNDAHFRWIHCEPHLSLTGLQANQRQVIRPGSEPVLLSGLIWAVHASGRARLPLPAEVLAFIPRRTREETAQRTGISTGTLADMERDLAAAQRPLLITGGVSTAHEEGLEAAVLAGLLQWMTGQIETRVSFADALSFERVGTLHDMERLAADLDAERVGVLFLARTDPVGDLGGTLSFPDRFRKAAFRIALTDLMNESARNCDLILPLSAPVESWGDDRSRGGLTTVIQPSCEPLHESKPEGDILLGLMNRATGVAADARSYQEYLFKRWNRERGDGFSQAMITAGFHQDAPARQEIALNTAATGSFLRAMRPGNGRAGRQIVRVWPIRSFDGRSGTLPLLEEIPDPLSTITYGSWLSVPESDAADLNIKDNDVVRVTAAEGVDETVHVKVQPLLPDGVYLAQADQAWARRLQIDERTGEPIVYSGGVRIEKTGHQKMLPILSGSPSQEGRGVIPDPRHLDEHDHHAYSFYPEPEFPEYHWTLAVDLDRCIGCSACVAACYIENNVPLVGPKEHLKGRELSWLRIEPYYEPDGSVYFLPVMCQHCDNAPCEPVCPVYATYHNPEGLNAQIYNRCVGTRYCANNCPYKVRRFNWFDPHWEGPLEKMLNPDIAVRGRGIMEKCTFCIQRIRAARDRAKDEKRGIRDGEVVPACAQTCPTGAIRFGNLLDKTSAVYSLAHDKRAFRVHAHLGTAPSVYYLNKKREPHGV